MLGLGRHGEFVAGARSYLFRKGTGSHHYKYAAAVFEDAGHTHPRWAARVLAPAVHYLPMAGADDAEVFLRARRALDREGR